MKDYLPLEEKELPKAIPLKKAIGVGIVITGLSIGTGELIMWPHLVTKYGLNILWAALLGIIFQYFINQEVGRLSLYTGESFFTTSSRFLKILPIFWFLSAIFLYIWPGWSTALGTTLTELFQIKNHIFWAKISLILIILLTFIGKKAYQLLENVLKIIVPLFFILLLINSFLNLTLQDIKNALKGLISLGYIPANINLEVFLGAIVFAGAGGLLNLCVSLWYKDKGLAMNHYAGQIVNPITGKNQKISINGFKFKINSENLKEWKKWMKIVKFDQGFIFLFLGFITLFLLSLNAYAILTPKNLVPEGLQIAVIQAHIFGEKWGKIGFDLFLIMAFLMLFSVMWTVIDAFVRIISDIIYVNSNQGPFEKLLAPLKKIKLNHLYYFLIVFIVLTNLFLINLKQPLSFLTISSVLGGFTMTIYTPLILYINNFKLPKEIRPNWFTNLFLFLAFIFYLYFSILLIKNYL
ncbi:MAG: Nramp family divalent metal transporter [Minisyncoccia bacterium]